MAKNNTINVASRQQQVSKILIGQLKANLNNMIKYGDYKNAYIFILRKSGYGKECSLTSFGTSKFKFGFQYGRRSGAVKVTYVNNDGLISTVYDRDEWRLLMDHVSDIADAIISDYEDTMEELERQKEEKIFQMKVDLAVAKALSRRTTESKNEGCAEM